MMKKRLTKLKLILILIIFTFINSISTVSKNSYDYPFKVGEKIGYDIYALNKKAGTISLEVKEITQLNGRDVFHIIVEIETSDKIPKSLYWMYNLTDVYMDVETLQPVIYDQKIQEKNFNDRITINYNLNKKEGTFSNTKSGRLAFEWNSDSIYDVVTGFYLIRSLNYSELLTNPIVINYLEDTSLQNGKKNYIKSSRITVNEKKKELTKTLDAFIVKNNSKYNITMLIADIKERIPTSIIVSLTITGWKAPIVDITARFKRFKK